jgi:hypothetical protein
MDSFFSFRKERWKMVVKPCGSCVHKILCIIEQNIDEYGKSVDEFNEDNKEIIKLTAHFECKKYNADHGIQEGNTTTNVVLGIDLEDLVKKVVAQTGRRK